MTSRLPEGRYSRNAGRAGPAPEGAGGRRRRVALSVAGALFGLGVAFVGYRNLAGAPVTADQQAYTIVNDSTISVRFDVTRSDPERAAVCIVRARSIDGNETGRREVYIAASTDRIVTVTTTVRTAAAPVASDIYGCGQDVPAYLQP